MTDHYEQWQTEHVDADRSAYDDARAPLQAQIQALQAEAFSLRGNLTVMHDIERNRQRRAEQVAQPATQQPEFAEPDKQLATFYNAKDYVALVRCMEHHIHKLQVKLDRACPWEKIAVTPVRQG